MEFGTKCGTVGGVTFWVRSVRRDRLTTRAVALTAGLIIRVWAAMVVMPLACTVAWSIPASSDDTGLWGVGAIMILIGTSVGVPIVALPGAQLREYLQRRRSKRLTC